MSTQQDKESEHIQDMMLQFQGLLESISYKIKQKVQHVHTDYQLASGQIFVMMMLYKQKMCKASDIAGHLGITSGAVTGLTDKLVNMGLLDRIRSEEDRRVVHFSLTEKGLETVKQIRTERMQIFMELFSKLEIEDLEKMLDVFNKLNAILE
ncbi:putative HTH-type transcriptional regulator YusO [compost metagenome]